MQELAAGFAQFMLYGFIFSYLVGLWILAKERKESKRHRETVEQFFSRIESQKYE